jgi:predicted NBD/HSP70 family sugar kinase/plasmid maintenance system antidote protein VapI
VKKLNSRRIDFMATLRDVARLAGVSKMTVSRVVNHATGVKAETRVRVESAIAQLGYLPSTVARLLAQKKGGVGISSTLGVSSSASAHHKLEKFSATHELSDSPDKRNLDTTAPSTAGETARTILRIVRAAQPISRVDLARRLEVNRGTVTEIVTPLIASGALCEAGPTRPSTSRRGRPPIGLSLRSERSMFIGVNVGVRLTQVGATAADGKLLDEASFDTSIDPNTTLAKVKSIVEHLRDSMPERALYSIGVSVPGPTDAKRRTLLFAPHLGWRNVEIAEALNIRNRSGANQSSGHVPVIVENDATAAAMYEARRRLHRSPTARNDFILVRAGTGIGVGLVLGGEVYRGTGTDRGWLGEFGHMTIVAGGKTCACGNRGCWEVYASAASAGSLYLNGRARGETSLRFVDIVARAEAGERRAQTALARVGEYLGIGIGNVITGVGVTQVVVSGRIVKGWKFMRKPIEDAVAGTMVGRLSNWSVEPGQPTGAGLGGAFEVAIEHYLAGLAKLTRAA